MKMIQRYAYQTENTQLGAGVAAGSGNMTMTVLFNITVNYFGLSGRSYDNVTNLMIQCLYQGSITGVDNPNPGLQVGNRTAPSVFTQSGRYASAPCHIPFAAGDVITNSYTLQLETVTANIIKNYPLFVIGYLCPEDYLRQEGLKAL